jgi:galactokinase
VSVDALAPLTLAIKVRTRFQELFERVPRLFAAPGRVNLIGEFTDYNDGFVLPMAIDRATVVAIAPRNDRRLRVHSMTLDATTEIDLDAPPARLRGTWVDYVEGIARTLEQRGAPVMGADLVIDSSVPPGAGLSSSAALEISVGLALLGIVGHTMPRAELAVAAQQAEHDFVGANCGIMDPLVAALGKAGHALLIDCRNLSWAPMPLEQLGAAVLVCDTRVRHSLACSAYNERRTECAQAAKLLREVLPSVVALRDVDAEEFKRVADVLPEPLRKRARHVVTENERTTAAAAAMLAHNPYRLGALMFASHRSLRDDFEVSAPELDQLVECARALDGVYGARMTGGGFGGCVVSLVARDAVPAVTRALHDAFQAAFGHAIEPFEARASDGGHEIV